LRQPRARSRVSTSRTSADPIPRRRKPGSTARWCSQPRLPSQAPITTPARRPSHSATRNRSGSRVSFLASSSGRSDGRTVTPGPARCQSARTPSQSSMVNSRSRKPSPEGPATAWLGKRPPATPLILQRPRHRATCHRSRRRTRRSRYAAYRQDPSAPGRSEACRRAGSGAKARDHSPT